MFKLQIVNTRENAKKINRFQKRNPFYSKISWRLPNENKEMATRDTKLSTISIMRIARKKVRAVRRRLDELATEIARKHTHPPASLILLIS